MLDLLRSLRARQAESRLAAGNQWEQRPEFADLVFTGARGQPVNPREDHERWRQLLATAGVPHARLHDARHTAATLLTALGVDSAVVQRLLGHSVVATTRAYQDLTVEMLRPAAEALSAALAEDSGDRPRERARQRRSPSRRPRAR